MNDGFDLALIKYVRAINEKYSQYMKSTYPSSPFKGETFEVTDGKQFAKINRCRGGKACSAYGFIAKYDNETKGLGKVRCGDLLRAASWSSPAKHARGNILDNIEVAIENSGPYGVAYLK